MKSNLLANRLFVTLGTWMLALSLSYSKEGSSHLNILFIAVDDLRPELGCYGAKQIQTPHIDELASSGTLFLNAYSNAAICGSSRASLLTGMRPIPGKRFMGYNCRSDYDAPGVPSLPEYLKQAGYYTISNGKMMHVQEDSPRAWTEPAWRSNDNSGAGLHHYNIYQDWVNPESAVLVEGRKGPFYESADVPDNAYHDGQVCEKTIADLKVLAESKEPFFLACGFWRPHLPFNAPKKYWDLYNREDIALADNRFRPKGAPKNLGGSGEIYSQYSANQGWPDDEGFHRLARHGYYACVSYIDAQVGKLLNCLEDLGLKKNTIVILWGDHGFHLGEHNFWGKHNTMNHSIHSPLIIQIPGHEGRRVEQTVEFVDIYPTVCEMLGLAIPEHCEGKSMLPIFNDPSRLHKEAVYIIEGNALSVKTKDYLYTEWGSGNEAPRMLYNHLIDPQENFNVSELPEYEKIAKYMHTLLQKIRHTF